LHPHLPPLLTTFPLYKSTSIEASKLEQAYCLGATTLHIGVVFAKEYLFSTIID